MRSLCKYFCFFGHLNKTILNTNYKSPVSRIPGRKKAYENVYVKSEVLFS